MATPTRRDPVFPVGTRVKLTNPETPASYRVGQTGTVVSVSESVIGADPAKDRPGDHIALHTVDFRKDVVRPDPRGVMKNYGNILGTYPGRCLVEVRKP